MESLEKTDKTVTVRFERKEFADLLAIVHSASVEYENLSVDIHNLSKTRVEKIEDDLFDLR